MTLKEVHEEMSELNCKIKHLLKHTTYDKYDDLSGLEYEKDPDNAFLREELLKAAGHLDDFRRLINYLDREIEEEGFLQLGSDGRYEIFGDSKYYTCGSTIEFLYYDDFEEQEKWCASSIESTGSKYYIRGYKNVPLDGLKVRVRKSSGMFEY